MPSTNDDHPLSVASDVDVVDDAGVDVVVVARCEPVSSAKSTSCAAQITARSPVAQVAADGRIDAKSSVEAR